MKLTAVIVGIVLATASVSFGQSSDAILDLLVKKGVITQREANEAREQLDQQAQQTVEMYSKTKASSWLDCLSFSGDLRLRAEYFSYEDSLNKPDRLRWRYRLRFAAEAKFPEWATINTRLVSSDGDPVSGNETLTEVFRKKTITIDVASVTIAPPWTDAIKIIGGRFDNPIWQPLMLSPMVFDYDVTPEGVAEQLQWKFGDNQQHRLFVNAGQYSLKEFSADSNDAYMFDQLAGIETKFGKDAKNPTLKVTAAGGCYLTHNLANVKAGDSPNQGNALIGASNTTNYPGDFEVAYARGEIAWNITDRPFLGTPALVRVAGEYDANLAGIYEQLKGVPTGVTSNDVNQTTAWTAGVTFGDYKKKGQWALAYQYKYLQADATFDATTDSDWGNGGTDRQGHVAKGIYMLQDWWGLVFTAMITEKISDRPNVGHNTVGVNGEDMLRVQVDTQFKF
jgi:hypothetical protein